MFRPFETRPCISLGIDLSPIIKVLKCVNNDDGVSIKAHRALPCNKPPP